VLATLACSRRWPPGAAATLALAVDAPWSRWTAGPLAGVAIVVVLVTLLALDLQVRLAAAIAPRLLGTAPEERLAVLHRTSHRLADHNRLARDLHDTIGLAAGEPAARPPRPAARSPLQSTTRPGRSTRPSPGDALEHIETNTRTALAELNRALAVLRDDAARPAGADEDPAGHRCVRERVPRAVLARSHSTTASASTSTSSAGSMSRLTSTIVLAGRTCAKTSP
jgi:hypothetical protein